MSIMATRVAQSVATPLIGIVRPGTKAITKAAQANPQVMAIANLALAGKISFIDAEKKILEQFKIRPFRPVNTEWYNVYPWDFQGGAQAVNSLLERYGEKRNSDQQARLYRLPVVFPDVSSPDSVIRGSLQMHVGEKYHSLDGEDGKTYCVYLPPVTTEMMREQKASRIKHMPRRQPMVRGECNPGTCPQFQAGQCKFRGELQFFVPGMTGLGVVAMRSGASYSLEDIYRSIAMLKDNFGRIPNFDNNGNPVFFLKKELRTAKFFDEEGKQVTSQQWTPVLEANIDSAAMIRRKETRLFLLQNDSPVAAPNLNAPASWVTPAAVHMKDLAVVEDTWYQDGQQDQSAHAKPEVLKQSDQRQKAEDAHAIARNEQQLGTQAERFDQGQDQRAEMPVAATTTVVQAKHYDSKLDELYDKAADFGDELIDFAKAKFGEGWDTEATAELMLGEVNAWKASIPVEQIAKFLPILTLCYGNRLDMDKVVRPYLGAKFGAFLRDPMKCAAIYKHLSELLESGPEVASTFMKNAVAAGKA
jgi:hypothetical protein